MAIAVASETLSVDDSVDMINKVTTVKGRWLVAVVTWNYLIQNQLPSINVSDAPRNIWTLIANRFVRAENVSAFINHTMNVQVWACPAVWFEGWNYDLVSTSIQSCLGSDQGTFAVDIIEFTGMGNGFLTVESITPYSANGTSSITLAAPAASANSLFVAAAAGAVNYGTYTTTGTGWTQLSNNIGTAPNLGQFAAWREGTTATSVTFALTAGTTDWTGVVVAFRTSGIAPVSPPGQNPNYPVVEAQLGFGYNLQTPLSSVWFTEQGHRYWGLGGKRGIQYELGQAQSEPSTVLWRNNDGTFSPRNVQSPAVITATASGTSSSFVCTTTDAAKLYVTDIFRLAYSPLNTNPGFESGTTGWTGTGGTLTTVTSPIHNGSNAGQMTPSGAAATVTVESAQQPVTAGAYYSATGWLRNAVSRSVSLNVNWYDAGHVYISTTSMDRVIPAATWTYFENSVVAPVGAAFGTVIPSMFGTPPATNVLGLDQVILKPHDEFTAFQITGFSTNGGATTVNFVEADGSGNASVATRTGDVLTVTPIDMYMPYQIIKTWNGKRHYVSSGWIERWPTTWVNPAWGTSGALTIGPLATITSGQQTAVAGEIMRRLPHSYWPCGDAAGSGSATNVSGRGIAPLVVTTNKAGAATQIADFGSSTQGWDTDPSKNTAGPGRKTTSLFGDPGTCWYQTFDDKNPVAPATIPLGAVDLNNSKGYALVANDSTFPSIKDGVTVFFAIVMTLNDEDLIVSSNPNPTVFILRDTDPADGIGQGSVIKVSVQNNTTYPQVTVWDKGTHASTLTVCNSGNQIHVNWMTIALTFNQTSWKLYTNATLAGSGSCNLVDSFAMINFGGESDRFASGRALPASLAHLAIFDRQLSVKEIEKLSFAVRYGFGNSSEFTSQRQIRLLDTINFKTARIAGDYTGQIVMDGQGTDSTTVADALGNISETEDGYLFEDAGAGLQIRPQGRYAEQKVRASLGGDVAGGDIPYLGDVTTDFDPTFVYDVVSVKNTVQNQFAFEQNLATSTFTAVNDQSTRKYNFKTYSRNTRIYGSQQQSVFYLVYWLLAQYSNPKQRFRTLTLNPISNPSLWDFCLSVEVGDLLLVKRTPLGAPPITETCVILQIQVDSTPGQYRVGLTLAPARSSGLVANDNPKGIAGSNYFTME